MFRSRNYCCMYASTSRGILERERRRLGPLTFSLLLVSTPPFFYQCASGFSRGFVGSSPGGNGSSLLGLVKNGSSENCSYAGRATDRSATCLSVLMSLIRASASAITRSMAAADVMDACPCPATSLRLTQTGVIVLRPDKAEHDDSQFFAVKICGVLVQNVYFL